MTQLPPAGWFPDPEAGGARWRWWDGTQWAPPGYGYTPAYDPVAHARALAMSAETSRNTGKWFRGLMAAQAGSALLAIVGIAIFVHGGLHFLDNDPDADVHSFRIVIGVQAFAAPWSIVSWGYMGTFIAWLFNAGKFADLHQWPARRSRSLGAFSVLIPIVNFWWPYEAICDLYPLGARPTLALRWFVAQLLIPYAAFMTVGVATVAAPSAVVALVAMIAGALLTIPVVLGWRLIDDLDAMQRAHLPAN